MVEKKKPLCEYQAGRGKKGGSIVGIEVERENKESGKKSLEGGWKGLWPLGTIS